MLDPMLLIPSLSPDGDALAEAADRVSSSVLGLQTELAKLRFAENTLKSIAEALIAMRPSR